MRLETGSALVDLTRENIDVALRARARDWPGLGAHLLFGHRHAAARPASCGSRPRGPRDLLTAPLIGEEADWAVWFAAAVPDVPLKTGPRTAADMQTIEVASALAGHGVALGSPILFAREIADDRLIQPFETVVRLSACWLAHPSERRRSPKIAAFREWILVCAADDPAIAIGGAH